MKRPFPYAVERGRIADGPYGSAIGSEGFGAFFIRAKANQDTLKIIASDGRDDDGSLYTPWEHVSVSHPRRCPTWPEMCAIKNLFFEPEEVVMQLHPAASEYVNNCRFCLHLWRPTQASVPLPDPILVGFKRIGILA